MHVMFQRQEFSDRFKSPCQSDNRQLSVWHLSYPSDLAFCPSLPTHSFLIRYKFTEQTQHRLPDRSRVRGGGHGEGHGEGGREGGTGHTTTIFAKFEQSRGQIDFWRYERAGDIVLYYHAKCRNEQRARLHRATQ